VRDHGRHLSEALQGRDVDVTTAWWERRVGTSLQCTSRDARLWVRELRRAAMVVKPSAILVHYSVFAFSYRGLPIFPVQVFGILGQTKTPIVTFLHEYAYPWGSYRWQGVIWAVTQRLVLWFVVARSSALIVTTSERSRWITSRWWLPRRSISVSPVFSNQPSPKNYCESARSGTRIGLFGYAHEWILRETILTALLAMRADGLDVTLRLVGAPGADSPAGRDWIRAAGQRGLERTLEFTGVMPAQNLSDALAACDVLLFAEADGPSSRKTTLAASLASGRPVIALAGTHSWDELVRSDAVAVVQPSAQALAETTMRLLADRAAADALGSRGRAFADRNMSLDRTATVVLSTLRDVVSRP
jgi:glycosyltransferase involved in cell wall biosynthesis